MAQEYCLLEGIPYHLEEDCAFSKQMLHILEDSGIICTGICLLNKHTLYFPKGKLQLIKRKCSLQAGDTSVLQSILHFRIGMQYIKFMFHATYNRKMLPFKGRLYILF
jgi:hypothetical protein